MGTEYFLGAMQQEHMHILLHEIGHTIGLDDFYDWTPSTGPAFVMKAGGANRVAEFDVWMMRDWWRHLKSRY